MYSIYLGPYHISNFFSFHLYVELLNGLGHSSKIFSSFAWPFPCALIAMRRSCFDNSDGNACQNSYRSNVYEMREKPINLLRIESNVSGLISIFLRIVYSCHRKKSNARVKSPIQIKMRAIEQLEVGECDFAPDSM